MTTPQATMIEGSQTDGRNRFSRRFDGTSNAAYVKKKTVTFVSALDRGRRTRLKQSGILPTAPVILRPRQVEIFGQALDLRVANVPPVQEGEQIQDGQHGDETQVHLPQHLLGVDMAEVGDGLVVRHAVIIVQMDGFFDLLLRGGDCVRHNFFFWLCGRQNRLQSQVWFNRKKQQFQSPSYIYDQPQPLLASAERFIQRTRLCGRGRYRQDTDIQCITTVRILDLTDWQA